MSEWYAWEKSREDGERLIMRLGREESMIYEGWIGTIYEQLKKSMSRDSKEQIYTWSDENWTLPNPSHEQDQKKKISVQKLGWKTLERVDNLQ